MLEEVVPNGRSAVCALVTQVIQNLRRRPAEGSSELEASPLAATLLH